LDIQTIQTVSTSRNPLSSRLGVRYLTLNNVANNQSRSNIGLWVLGIQFAKVKFAAIK